MKKLSVLFLILGVISCQHMVEERHDGHHYKKHHHHHHHHHHKQNHHLEMNNH